jgi:hypothetical protein
MGGVGTGQTYDLVSFSKGLGKNSSLTPLITGLTLGVGNPTYPFRNVVSIKVTYNPFTNEWKMYQRDEGVPTAYPSPFNVSDSSLVGATTSSFQTGVSMSHFGFLMNFGVDGTTTNAYFDNFKCTVNKPDINIVAPGYLGSPIPSGNRGYYFSRFIYALGYGPSPEQILTITGTDLSDSIKVTAPANYELRDTAGGNVIFKDSIALYPTDNIYGTKSLPPTSFYVRLKAGLAMGNYDTVRIKFVSTSLFRNDVFCNGTVVDSNTAFLNISTAELTRFSNTDAGKFSSAKNFSVSGVRLGASNLLINAPTDYQLSTDNVNFTSSVSLTPVSGTVPPTNIYVRFAPIGGRPISYDSIVISHPSITPNSKVIVNGYLGSYYYRTGAGAIATLSSWKAKSDGTGTSPTRFSVPGVYYRIIADSVATTAPWTVDSSAVIVVGDSLVSARSILTIAFGSPITTTNSQIDIPSSTGAGKNKLYIQDGTYPSFGTMHSSSEVHMMASKSNSGTNASFGNLFIEGTGVSLNFSGKPIIQKSLTIGPGASMQTVSGTTYGKFTMMSGATLTNNGAIYVINKGGFSCGNCTVPATAPSSGYFIFYFADAVPQGTFSSSSLVKYQSTSGTQNMQPFTYGNLEITNAITNALISVSGGNTPGGLTANNLILPATATFSLGANSVTINGGVTGSGNFLGSPVSNLTLGGTSDSLYFSSTGKVIKNLVLNANATVRLRSALEVTAGSSPGSLTVNSGANFYPNSLLELKSDSLGTARVAPSYGNILGRVRVERFIQSKRAWRFLSMPMRHVSGQSIRVAWMEGATSISSNPVPGFGTIITDSSSAALTNGFDAISPGGPSVKYYDPTTDNWVGITSTLEKFQPGKAYMSYIRGSRASTPTNSTADATVLRELDTLNVGNVTISLGSYSSGGKYLSAGNPYASAVSLTSIVKRNLDSSFYLWDPVLSGSYGIGDYISLTRTGNTILAAPLPPTGSSYANSVFDLQSGQGFFVRSVNTDSSSVSFSESGKVASSQLVSRTQSSISTLRTNLFKVGNGQVTMTGGVLHAFDASFDDAVTPQDAQSPFNNYQNFAILNSGSLLSIDCRTLPKETDTFFFNLGRPVAGMYRLEFIPELLGSMNVEAYLEDTYLHTITALSSSDTGRIDFTVVSSDTLSFSSNRFRIVFKRLGVVAISRIDLQAAAQNSMVLVKWTAQNVDADRYVIERSSDGISFSVITNKAASGNSAPYTYVDRNPLNGNSYYRVRGVSVTGEERLSNVARVLIDRPVIRGLISPNPVIGNQQIRIAANGLDAGFYDLEVLSEGGQSVYKSAVSYNGSGGSVELSLPASLPAGSYRLILSNSRVVIKEPFMLLR